jgi:hypothetical protein
MIDVAPLRAARQFLELTIMELWIDYFALGGIQDAKTLAAYLNGDGETSPGDHDAIVQALNEVFIDRGLNHPLDYAMT